MQDLIASFSLPGYLWVLFGFFVGGILASKNFRNEADGFIAHTMGWKPKRKRRG